MGEAVLEHVGRVAGIGVLDGVGRGLVHRELQVLDGSSVSPVAAPTRAPPAGRRRSCAGTAGSAPVSGAGSSRAR